MKNLKLKLILALVVLSVSVLSSLMPVSALNCASPGSSKEQIQCGACSAASATATSCDPAAASGSLSNTVKTIINVMSVLAGAAAVVMIIVGGFRYVASSGNAESTKSARNTIVYALVGLVIIAFAQIIVHFVLTSL